VAYRVEFTARAAEEFRDLPKPVRKRIIRWLDLLAEDPRRLGTKQLEGRPELRRVHAGKDYVIIYTILGRRFVVLVVRIAHRSEAYRGLPL